LGVGASSWKWDFGDGARATGCCPGHRYRKDGDYTVTLAIKTPDGRTASGTQLAHVVTHDVGVAALSAPARATAGQTKAVEATMTSDRYPEFVAVVITRRIGKGQFESIADRQNVQVAPRQRAKLSFPYTFTEVDAAAGRVTFQAEVSLNVGATPFRATTC
jgi:PKD domain